jgi:hypothetical protein
MNRQQLEHILRAAGRITGYRDIVVIGSQAILASAADLPGEMLMSMEADVYPLEAPDDADKIEGAIGELSEFHNEFGYYAHGVGPETAILPRHWKSRLVKLSTPSTNGTVGLCLSPLDLAVSKLVAGREKDISFVRGLRQAGLILESELERVASELTPEDRRRLLARLPLLR